MIIIRTGSHAPQNNIKTEELISHHAHAKWAKKHHQLASYPQASPPCTTTMHTQQLVQSEGLQRRDEP